MKLFLSICLLLFVNYASSQVITKVGKNKYEYNGNIYQKRDLGPIFDAESVAQSIFFRAENQRQNCKIFSYTGLGGFVAGNLMLYRASVTDDFYNIGYIFTGVLTAYIIAPLLSIIAIPFAISASKNYKKAISFHNFDYIELNGYEKDQSHFNIKVTNHGLGVVYSF